MNKLIFFVLFIPNISSAKICQPCVEGVRVCIEDVMDLDSSYTEVCPGVFCTKCERAGFREKRFVYTVQQGNQFIWMGQRPVYYSERSCKNDRSKDIRCQ